MPKITKDMTFNEVLRMYPDSQKVLRKYGMQCFGCLGAEAESIEAGAAAHGLDADTLVRELNEALPEKNRS